MQRVWGAQFFILALLFRRVVCDAQCFGVGGQKSSAAPCNSDVTGTNGSHSACCDESKQEACLSTGLCYATQRTDNITFWAEGCTDPSGLDPSCPQVCGTTSQFITGPLQPTYTMLFCGSSSWCCCFNSFGKRCDTSDCCSRNFTLARGLGQVVRQFDDSPGGDPSASAAGPAASSLRNPGGGAFTSRMIIAIISSVLGTLLLATSVAFLFSLLNNRKLRRQLNSLEAIHTRTQSVIAAAGIQGLRISTSMNVKDEAASQISYDMTPSAYHAPLTPSSMGPGYGYPTPMSSRRPSLPRTARRMDSMSELGNGMGISELSADKDMR